MTKTQARVLRAIERLSQAGYPPSRPEIAREMGWASDHAVNYHLEALRAAGRVSWEPRKPRTLKVVAR